MVIFLNHTARVGASAVMWRIASDLENVADICGLNLCIRRERGGMKWEQFVEVKLGVLQLTLFES